MSKKQEDEAQNITVWQEYLRVFKGLIAEAPPADEVRDKLVMLGDNAMNSSVLTVAQRRAIQERCQNYLDGSYKVGSEPVSGKTKAEALRWFKEHR